MLHDYAILQKCTHIYYLLFLKDSFAEQKQVKYLLECIRQAERGKQKAINPKDLLIDFGDVITSKLPVSNKPISKKPPAHKISEEYGIASSSKSWKNSDSINLDNDYETKKSKNKKHQNKRKRKRSDSRSSSEEKNNSNRRVLYSHLSDLTKDLRDALRVSYFVSFISFLLFMDFTN